MKLSQDMKDAIRAEYAKVWSGKMLDYCCGKVSRAIRLPDGKIVIWEKPTIETRFCFGESGYDYDDAAKMAAHAKSDEDYFKRENLKQMDLEIGILECPDYRRPYLDRTVYSGAEPLNLYTVSYKTRAWAEENGAFYFPLEGENLRLVLEAYQAERAAFEKRLNTYLKRYGLSNVRSWTYWRDA